MTCTMNRLLTQLSLGTVLLAGCASKPAKDGNLYATKRIKASLSPVSVWYTVDKNGNIYESTNKIEFTPLDYAENIIATSHDQQMVKIAHVILDGATLSETLDHNLADRKNIDPAASKKLNNAAIELGRATHHSTLGVFGAADSLNFNPKHDAAVTAAYEARARTAEVTGNLVMDNAGLFQTQGIKAAGEIQSDFDNLNLFVRKAKTIEGISVK